MRSLLTLLLLTPALASPQQPGAPGPGGGPAAGSSETGFSLLTSFAACDPEVLHASTSTRAFGVNTPQTCPFTLAMPAIPAGKQVALEVLVWHYLCDSFPATDTILINGTPVTGTVLGEGEPDLCWPTDRTVAYWAPLPAGLVNHGGSNTIDGACDDAFATALGEGLSLVTIVEADCDAGTTQLVDVFGGFASTMTSGTPLFASFSLDLTSHFEGGVVDLWINALDGQDGFPDEFFVNGVSFGGVLDGTFSATDAFAGLVGPDPCCDNLYDVVSGDISSTYSGGEDVVEILTHGVGDCVGHSFAVVIYDTFQFPCGFKTCDTNPDNVADLSVDTCDCGAGSILLTMTSAPANQPGYLMISAGNGTVTNPPGAVGDLCLLGGPIARYVLDVASSGPTGTITTDVLNANTGGGGGQIPAPLGGNLCVPPGQTFYFQYWHRDGTNPSRFSKGLQVTFH